jgi:hypothetical protein
LQLKGVAAVSFSFLASESSGNQLLGAGAPARSKASTDAPPHSGGAGLVYSSTSRTALHIDPHEARMRRMKNVCITASRLHDESVKHGGFRGRWAFLTLTYAEQAGWKPGHISAFLDCIKQWLKRRGCTHPSYVWVAELQRRGAMHYHVLMWLKKGLTLPKPDKQGWWPHGMTKIEWARNPVGYMAKYASKADGPAKFPKGARIHGCAGLRGKQLQEARYWKRPTWLREKTGIDHNIRRRAGGGWIDADSGEIFRSPWSVMFEFGGIWLHRLEAPPDNNVMPEKYIQGNSHAALVS